MNKSIDIKDIPSGVTDELNLIYKTVKYHNYNAQVTASCITRKFRYTELVEENVKTPVMNPETFEREEKVCNIIKYFIIRGIETTDKFDVFSIYSFLVSVPVPVPVITGEEE